MRSVQMIVWQRSKKESLRHLMSRFQLEARKIMEIVGASVSRFLTHRDDRLRAMLVAQQPLAHEVVSIRTKWDETQQRTRNPVDPDAQDGLRTSLTTSVLTTTSWFKTSSMTSAVPWSAPLCKLSRTTAECIWTGLGAVSACPFGAWRSDVRIAPAGSVARWVIFGFVCDDASSNRRLIAHAEHTLLKHRRRVITMTCKCTIHGVHRVAAPIMKTLGGVNELYRAANALGVSTYWVAMVKQSKPLVDTSLVVVHNIEVDENHRRVARQILLLVLGDGLPEELLPKRVIKLIQECLDSLVGDFTSSTILWKCPGGCTPETCRPRAVEAAKVLLKRVMFSRKIVTPMLSRWWKYTPAARAVLGGLGVHKIWVRVAPRRAQDRHGQDDDAWHAIHSWRVAATFRYFSDSSTVPNLVITLVALGPGHRIMAWILSKDVAAARGTRIQRRSFYAAEGRDGHEQDSVAGAQGAWPVVVRQYVEPRTSPVYSALVDCHSLLNPEDSKKHWAALFAFNREGESAVIKKVWSAVLPSAGRIWWKILRTVIEWWPLRFVSVASPNDATSLRESQRFRDARRCCIPRGIRSVHDEVQVLQKPNPPWIKQLSVEMAHQWDFSIFDQEVNHGYVRSTLETAEGHEPNFASTSMQHFTREVILYHHRAAPQAPAHRPRGRPTVERQKRKRFCPWNAFVQVNKEKAGQGSVKSGSFLGDLGARWRRMTDDEKLPYVRMSRTKNLEDEEASEEEASQQTPLAWAGSWSLGNSEFPLSPDLMRTPTFSDSLAQQVEALLLDLDKVIEHQPCLPAHVSYDDCCRPWLCKEDTSPSAERSLKILRTACNIKMLSMFLVIGEGPSEYYAQVYMVAHRFEKPLEHVLLPMVPCGNTLLADITSFANMPWSLQFHSVSVLHGRHLGFVDDAAEMVYMLEQARSVGCSSLEFHPLDYQPQSLNTASAKISGPAIGLWSDLMEDLEILAQDANQEKSHVEEGPLDDLRDLVSDQQPQRRQRQRGAQVPQQVDFGPCFQEEQDFVESVDPEYGLDLADVARDVADLHDNIEAERAALAALDGSEEDPFESAGACSSSSSSSSEQEPEQEPVVVPPPADDWSHYDRHIHYDGRHYQVLKDGVPVGRLEPFRTESGYRCGAVCFRPEHRWHRGRCTRLRGMRRGEEPEHVDRTLVKWLLHPLEAGEDTKEGHRAAPRD